MTMTLDHEIHGMDRMLNHRKKAAHEGTKTRREEMGGIVRELLELREMVG
jgi:hypothetical protein